MRLVCVSDSHCQHRKIHVPDGDVFIHAGDFTCHGYETDVRDFAAWLRDLPHPHKIVIAGNHDVCFEEQPKDAVSWLDDAATYLCNSGCEISGLNFWGTPYTCAWSRWAFMRPRGTLGEIWAQIPENTDILITHSPPRGTCDLLGSHSTHRGEGNDDGRAGDDDLALAVARIRPKIHVFGHIHGASVAARDGTLFANVSVVIDPGNHLVTGCTVIDL